MCGSYQLIFISKLQKRNLRYLYSSSNNKNIGIRSLQVHLRNVTQLGLSIEGQDFILYFYFGLRPFYMNPLLLLTIYTKVIVTAPTNLVLQKS